MHWILLVTLPCLVVAQCISKNDNLQTNDSETSMNFPKAQLRLGLKLLKILNEIRPDQSTSFSPYTIFHNLLLSYFISDEDTAKKIKKVLFQSAKQSRSKTFRSFKIAKSSENKNDADNEPDNEFYFANYMWYPKDVFAQECIEKLLKDELVQVDFSNPSSDLATINKFVGDFTNGKIPDFLAADSVNKDSSLILANAAYFKRLWKTQFPAASIRKNVPFRSTSSEKKTVDMMRISFPYNYGFFEEFNAPILQIPFQKQGVSMILFMPDGELDAIDQVIKDLDETSFAKLLDLTKLEPTNVYLDIPRFTVEDTIDLKMPFKQLGLADLFEKNANFARLTGPRGENYLTGVIHRSKFEVDEKGESKSVPGSFDEESSVYFYADHPFMYIVYDSGSKNILFLGVFK